jgi:cyanophycinase
MVRFPLKRSLVVLTACLLLVGVLTPMATFARATAPSHQRSSAIRHQEQVCKRFGVPLAPGPCPGGLPKEFKVFPRVGSTTDSVFTPAGPGLVLDGGGLDVDEEFVWMRSTLSADKTRRLGDVVVLTAEGNSGLDSEIYNAAPFNSVQTINLPPPSTQDDLKKAASIIDKVEAVFFDGGNQANYTAWAGSPLMAAVQRVYERGGVVGGTSAGLAILGQYVFDSSNGSVSSDEALANPYSPLVTFTRNMLRFPPLTGWITDTHFDTRNRFGRLTVFMARQIADGAVSGSPPQIYGVGVDESDAVVVDKRGKANLLQSSSNPGAAYFLVGGPATQVEAGEPLIYPNIKVTRLDDPGQYYKLTKRCGTGPTYTISVDARQTNPFGNVDPYSAPGDAGTCS